MSQKEFFKLLDKKRKEAYLNSDSVLKEYDLFWEMNGLYRSDDIVTFRKKIKGCTELCEGLINLYDKAQLPNEKSSILDDLFAIGYDDDKLVELILKEFYHSNSSANLWSCADLLYSIKNFKYLPQYLAIIKDEFYGTDRQMLVLLVGKSKSLSTVPTLKELLNDPTVYGHALKALSNFSGEDIEEIMHQHLKCKIAWIRNIARKYLDKKNK